MRWDLLEIGRDNKYTPVSSCLWSDIVACWSGSQMFKPVRQQDGIIHCAQVQVWCKMFHMVVADDEVVVVHVVVEEVIWEQQQDLQYQTWLMSAHTIVEGPRTWAPFCGGRRCDQVVNTGLQARYKWIVG